MVIPTLTPLNIEPQTKRANQNRAAYEALKGYVCRYYNAQWLI